MSRNILIFVAMFILGASTMQATPRTVLAQRVRVGGGGVHVRAPFVRVDVYPDGGTSVRAPFTAIDTPGRVYYYEPAPRFIDERASQPSFPTAADIAAMDDAQLDQVLRWISESLHRRLNRFNTGATWQRYLRLPEEAIAHTAESQQRGQALAKVLNRFHLVASDPQYAMIAQLPAFAAKQAALSEAMSRLDGSQATGDNAVEELPLPLPERPARQDRDAPFLTPKQR